MNRSLRAIVTVVLSCALLAPLWSPASAEPRSAARSCDPAPVLGQMRTATGGRSWNGVQELSAWGTATVAGLRGTARFDDDLARGRFAERFRIAVQGPSADVYDGATRWSQDISGGVHALDAPFARGRAITDAYLARRGYFEPSAARTATCLGARSEHGHPLIAVRIVPSRGIPADLLIDARTHLLASVSEVLPISTQVTHYADYRKTGGLLLPFSISSGTTFEPTDGFTVAIARYVLRRRAIDHDFARPTDPNDAVIVGNKPSTTVRMTLEAQELIVWASLDGHAPMPFILDTGGHAILTALAARTLGLRSSGGGESGGSGAGTIAVRCTRVQRVRIGDAELRDQPFLVIPYPHAFYERGRRTPLAGIIGLEFFERYATRIDYANQRVTFTPLARFRYRGNGTAIPFRFQDDMPMVEARADGYPGLFGTDTGNSGSLILFGRYLDRNGFFARYRGGFTILGHGTGGTNTGRPETLRAFTIGDHHLSDVPSDFTQMKSGSFSSWTEAGNIGYDVLSHFVPTFDYAHETLYLETSTHPAAVLTNRAGLWVTKNGPGAFEVTIVRPDGPAARAGIAAGDRITIINGVAAPGLSRADLVDLVSGASGKPLRLRVQHAAKERDVTLVLRQPA